MKINKLRLRNRDLYLIIQYELFLNEDDLLDTIAQELENGVSIVQINYGHALTSEAIKITKKLRELCSIYNVLLIVNDRLDIAQIIEADGVFIDKNSFSVKVARDFLGDNYIIGTNYFEENIDFIITEQDYNIEGIPCYKSSLASNDDNKKIIYKKI
ncbi:MAG: thiamine phosphate synthase [Candidatus Gastranaerophilales bacterium]|nr:thiamine phosphate synthase [Candidatus Gastranaerophilales bacterium]